MNLRAMFQPRQLLSAMFGFFTVNTVLVSSSCLLLPSITLAQAPAGTDAVVMKPAAPGQAPRTLQGVLITGMQGTRMMVRDASGEIGYDVKQVDRVVKAAPPEFAKAQQAVESGNFEAALPLVKAVADRYKGLPVAWAMESTVMLANLYVSTDKLAEAVQAFADVERLYGGGDSPVAKVGKARLAAARKRYSEAKDLAKSVVGDVMNKKNVTRAESQLYGQAFFVLGQCAEGENNLPEAMENYCKTVAIFYQDPAIVKEAQKRIDDLRGKSVTTP